MNFAAYHPLYEAMLPIWSQLRDAFAGEETVKSQGTKYLPPTAGQVLDGMTLVGKCNPLAPGYISYFNYKERAVFPDFVTEGVRTLVGILNEKPAKVLLPPEMEFMRDRATPDREGINVLLRSIHEQLLITGRAGLLADMPVSTPGTGVAEHYIALYKAEKIVNWDSGSFNGGEDKLNLVVLDETGYRRKNAFEWTETKKTRILMLGGLDEVSELGNYSVVVVEGDDATTERLAQDAKEPFFEGTKIDFIPFVFVGPNDLSATPPTPPLQGLSRICYSIYKSEADYRYSLYMQAQETLVVTGGIRTNGEDKDAALRVGADARIDVELNGDAKYIGVSASGLSEQREALKSDRELAAVRTGQLLAPGKASMESGEALKTRIAAQTATLTSIAETSAAAMQASLRQIARWRGLDESKCVVTPNLEFTNFAIQGQDLVQMITAKKLGFPVSFKTLHDNARERGMTRLTYEEEIKEIKADDAELIKRMEAENEATGNNPQNQAGGPKEKVEPTRQPSNVPKE